MWLDRDTNETQLTPRTFFFSFLFIKYHSSISLFCSFVGTLLSWFLKNRSHNRFHFLLHTYCTVIESQCIVVGRKEVGGEGEIAYRLIHLSRPQSTAEFCYIRQASTGNCRLFLPRIFWFVKALTYQFLSSVPFNDAVELSLSLYLTI